MDNALLEWAACEHDIDTIIQMMENCDRNCKTCSKIEKADCLLEQREAIHELAKIMKLMAQSLIELKIPSENVSTREIYS